MSQSPQMHPAHGDVGPFGRRHGSTFNGGTDYALCVLPQRSVVAAAIFGKEWSGEIVEFRVDNMAVVHVINATFCSDNHLMHLIRLLVFFASYHNF